MNVNYDSYLDIGEFGVFKVLRIFFVCFVLWLGWGEYGFCFWVGCGWGLDVVGVELSWSLRFSFKFWF